MHRIFTTVCWLLTGLTGLVYSAQISADLRQILNTARPDERIPVIVRLRDADAASQEWSAFRGRSGRPDLIRALRARHIRGKARIEPRLAALGVDNIKSLWVVNAVAFEAPPHVIALLSKLPAVESFSLDQTLTLSAPPEVTAPPAATWNIDLLGAPLLWNEGIDGAGVTIAVMDTGVDLLHPDLTGSWRGGDNSWLDPYGQYALPDDPDGHGTQVAGILIGGSSGGNAIGMAPGASWIAVRLFDDQGQAEFSVIHQAFQWLLDPDDDPDTDDLPDIINASWGLIDHVNECVIEFDEDIDLLRAAGVGIVFAAGNDGPAAATSLSPANYPACISVGAVDINQTITLFSSRGPSACGSGVYPTLTAPGTGIRTTDMTAGGVFPFSYTYADGTSFAAPHVAGALALLRCAFAEPDTAVIEQALIETAADLGPSGPDDTYGYGLLHAARAYRKLAVDLYGPDLNRDGVTDLDDLRLMAAQWLQEECLMCPGDLTLDGIIDYRDFATWN